jgi:hypothetical protein
MIGIAGRTDITIRFPQAAQRQLAARRLVVVLDFREVE